MERMDDSGQWLLLGAMIVAIGMAVLIVFVNQSILAGHSSSQSIMDFPKNEIREFRAETVNEAYVLGRTANMNGTSLADRQARFESAFDHYSSDLKYIFGTKGTVVRVQYFEGLNLSMSPGGQSLDNVTLVLYYNNGDTKYNETSMVYLK
jgi:hypothetical protein